jgi:hypothetical protein
MFQCPTFPTAMKLFQQKCIRMSKGKFGWCLTNQHDICLTKLISEDRQCTCECHTKN